MRRIAFASVGLLGLAIASPASAQTVITQAKALAGNVTPGDAAGFPVTLSQPGAYRLDSNLTVPANLGGIQITSNNVDIDLNGFLLLGSGGGTYGIISGYAEGRIHNGVIKGFTYSGIYLRGLAWTIEDIKVLNSGGIGIDATDTGSIEILISNVSNSGSNGINTGDNEILRDSFAKSNNGTAFLCYENCNVTGNTIDRSAGHGLYIKSGIVIGNTISKSKYYAIYGSTTTPKVGIVNNVFIENFWEIGGENKIYNVVPIHPNTCVGKPC